MNDSNKNQLNFVREKFKFSHFVFVMTFVDSNRIEKIGFFQGGEVVMVMFSFVGTPDFAAFDRDVADTSKFSWHFFFLFNHLLNAKRVNCSR